MALFGAVIFHRLRRRGTRQDSDRRPMQVLGRIGDENVLGLRCIRTSRRLDHFCEERLNHRAASNGCLAVAAS